ncbi:MAG: hypothetical protein V6Z82_04105 [Flavobacteriales bacterium]
MKNFIFAALMLLGTAALTSASRKGTEGTNQSSVIDELQVEKMQAEPEYGAIPVYTSCGKLGFIIYEKGTKTSLAQLGKAAKKLEDQLCGPKPSPFI